MAYKRLDVTLSAAALQGLAANTYFWIDRLGNLISTGGAALVGSTSVPPDQAIMDVSQDNGTELFVEHGVLTGAVGGKVSFAEISSELPSSAPPATAPTVVGATTIDQALAATAESVKATIQAAAPAQRIIKGALAILFTTSPTGATPTRIRVWGHRDGVNASKG